MKIKSLLPFLTCVLIFSHCSTQTLLEGTVLDPLGEPLIGAGVTVKGTAVGTVTDLDGRFSLALTDSSAILVISYLGYRQEEVPVGGVKWLKVKMKEASALIDEVVVTGMKRKEKERNAKAGHAFAVEESTGIEAPRTYSAPPPPPAPAPAAIEDSRRMSLSSEGGSPEDGGWVMAAEGSDDFATLAPGALAGTLTAGEVHDFSKWELWRDVSEEDLAEWRDHWRVFPSDRYTLQLTNEAGQSIVDCPVRLLAASGAVVWRGRTDNTGKAELWSNLFTQDLKITGNFRLVADWRGQTHELGPGALFQQGINHRRIAVTCDRPSAVDIAFVVDATGSMTDEIDYLKAELADVIGRVRDTLPQVDLNLGAVFYRDEGDEYLTRHSDLSPDITRTVSFIREQNANGGGDTPEAVDEALRVALATMSWRETAVARLLFLVLDAPPHHNAEVLQRLRELTQEAAARGIRIVPVVCSGMDKSGEYLLRSLALATNGTYLFLTDDSGVGSAHLEPATDAYDVEKLNALMTGVIYRLAYTPTCEEERPPAVLSPSDTTLVVVNLSGNAAEPGDDDIQFSFYPNPTTGPLTVETDGPIGQLFLTDFAGKILERFRLDGPRLALDLGQYPAGTYHLRYLTANEQWAGGRVVLVRM